jgi:hypothetical protein
LYGIGPCAELPLTTDVPLFALSRLPQPESDEQAIGRDGKLARLSCVLVCLCAWSWTAVVAQKAASLVGRYELVLRATSGRSAAARKLFGCEH